MEEEANAIPGACAGTVGPTGTISEVGSGVVVALGLLRVVVSTAGTTIVTTTDPDCSKVMVTWVIGMRKSEAKSARTFKLLAACEDM